MTEVTLSLQLTPLILRFCVIKIMQNAFARRQFLVVLSKKYLFYSRKLEKGIDYVPLNGSYR